MDPRKVLDLNLDLTRATGVQLDAQRRAILAILDDPKDGDDLDALAARAAEIGDAIEAHNKRAADRDAARRRLGGTQVAAQAPAVPVAAGQRSQEEEEADPAERVITGRLAARELAADPRVRGYSGHGQVHLRVEGELHERALFDSADFPSQPTRVPGILQPTPDGPLTLLGLIDRQPLGTDSIEWVQETSAPTGAVEVTEGSAKPESTFGFSLETTSAATIAHYINITRQSVADERQLEGYVRGRMSRGLMARVNAQILGGDGIAPNLEGIINTSGIGTYTQVNGEDPLISVRKARTVAELSEYAPTAVVINPVDWELIELSTDSNGQFRVVSSVASGAAPRLWGMAVVVSTNITGSTAGVGNGGRFLLGSFREGATLWERTGVDFYITDSHASNFTSNILTLLAELRAALTVWRPAAFVYGQFADLA